MADAVPLALSTVPEYMFATKTFDPVTLAIGWDFETVTANQVSPPVCLAPTSEGHGVRGFLATIIWPTGTTAGAVEIDGADLNEDAAYAVLGTITFPAVQYSSPSGLVVNFMRMVVTAVPVPAAQLMGRVMIR